MTVEIAAKISKTMKGKMPANFALFKGCRKGVKLTEEHKQKLREAKLKNPIRYWLGKKYPYRETEARKKYALSIRGKNNPRWNGLNIQGQRCWVCYGEWKNKVFKRDDYTCLNCGERGGRLEAHHVYPFADYPKLRLDLDNGVTLCYKCHHS